MSGPADLPAVLLPYQAEAIARSHANPLFVCEKSRRTGLTYGFAADGTLTAASAKADGGMDVFYIAYNLDMTREFIGYVGEFAKAFDQVATVASEFLFDDGSEAGIKAFRIDFPSGNSVVALSSKPRSLRGKQGLVIIDEAAFHDQLAELLKAAIALLMWGGRVVVISTHDGADNPFNELIEEIRSGDREGDVMRLTLKDALKQGLYKRICLRTGKDWSQEAEDAWEAWLRKTYRDSADEELDVVPARGSGTYMARATIEAVMTPDLQVLRLRCPDGFEREPEAYRTDFIREWLEDNVRPLLSRFDRARRSYFGQDFARTGDVSPVMFGQEDDLLVLRALVTVEMRNVPFTEQLFLMNWIVERLPLFTAGKMDGRGNGQQLAEQMSQRWGFDRIEAVMATDATYLKFMPRLRARIEDRTFLLPLDRDVLEDMRMVKLVRGVPKIPDAARMPSKEDGSKGKRHGDVAIASMHLVAAADEDLAPIDLHTLPGSRASAGDYTTTSRGFGTIKRAAGNGDLAW